MLWWINNEMLYQFWITFKWKLWCNNYSFWKFLTFKVAPHQDNQWYFSVPCSCTDTASVTDRPCSEQYSCCKCVQLVHFVLINLFHYYSWRNVFRHSPQSKVPQIYYSLLLPHNSPEHCVVMVLITHLRGHILHHQMKKKHSQSASSVANFVLFIEFLKASLTAAV